MLREAFQPFELFIAEPAPQDDSSEIRAGEDLYRFLVVCALVSDLYCPGYNPKQSLAKDSDLARTAARYKIDSAKIATAVRAELSKAKARVKDESQAAKKPTTAISSRKSSK
jgi:hypothetical protein